MIDAVSLPLLIEAVLAITLIEGAVLVIYHHRRRAGVAPRDFLANLISGAFLMLALLGFAHQVGTLAIAACLLAAGVAHGADLWMRWRRPAPSAFVVSKGAL